MEIGKLGMWFFLDAMSAEDSAAFAKKTEQQGYSALWMPEAAGREPFSHAAYLLSKTDRLILATGIANVWARGAMAMMAGARTCAELSGGRFLLGIGVSHAPLVSKLRGEVYSKPYSYMKEYLPQMKASVYA
ncbi:MAG: LLM class flavin-dependent oxidoreductase, partial [Candidatus Binatia bacterium]